MRRLPFALAGLFVALTLTRVAWFAADALHAGPLGYLFSVGMGAAVYASSYWTRTQTTRRAALVSLALFVAADGYFNLTEVVRSIDWYNVGTMVQIAAVVYGLFPTCAAALLGWLQSSINRLPPVAHKQGQIGQMRTILVQRVIDRLTDGTGVVQDAPEVSAVVPQIETGTVTRADLVRAYMLQHGVSRTTAYRHVAEVRHDN